MTAQDNRLQFSVEVDVTIRKATRRDVNRLEWHGEYAHFRRLFQRSYHEQQKGNRLMLVAVINEFPIARLFIQMSGRKRTDCRWQPPGVSVFISCDGDISGTRHRVTAVECRGYTVAAARLPEYDDCRCNG